MYKLLLILRYLHTQLAPLFAALAVTVCSAMVIIVISVMGGFLDTLERTVQTITGDLVVTPMGSLTGFPHYEDMIVRLEALPEIEAATPIIQTFGLINFSERTVGVQIEGIQPGDFERVVPYKDTLHWSADDFVEYVTRIYANDDGYSDEQLALIERVKQEAAELDLTGYGMSLTPPDEWQPPEGAKLTGMVPGIELYNSKLADGSYAFNPYILTGTATITTIPLSPSGNLTDVTPRHRQFVIVNEAKAGHYEADSRRVFVPFDDLQVMLDMHSQTELVGFDEETGEFESTRKTPARTSRLNLKVAEGFTLEQGQAATKTVVDAMITQHDELVFLEVLTWRQQHRQLLSAVANEKGMVTFLFIVISGVAIVMVATTFYMIVLDKTRDIGTLRAIGAGRMGIMSLFLGYGLAIGLVGSSLGYVLAHLVVTRLNDIQWLLANVLGTITVYVGSLSVAVLLALILGTIVGLRRIELRNTILTFLAIGIGIALLGSIGFHLFGGGALEQLNNEIRFVMWDPAIYAFDRIPARLDMAEVLPILVGAVMSSVVGALIPAVRSAVIDPIVALRYE